MKTALRILVFAAGVYAALVLLFGCASVQRKLLYFPSHLDVSSGLSPWIHDSEILGYAREVENPKNIWLMLHGNGGQAAHRGQALPCFSPEDSVYVLEYPGYGWRSGTPSTESINAAAQQAYVLLKARHPNIPLCVVGESLGSGPACLLARQPQPPAKIVLIVPYDRLNAVAAEHYPYLPVRLIMQDNWDNLAALASYQGPIDLFAATYDTVIPVQHARTLAASRPQIRLTEFPAGHNDWIGSGVVKIRNP